MVGRASGYEDVKELRDPFPILAVAKLKSSMNLPRNEILTDCDCDLGDSSDLDRYHYSQNTQKPAGARNLLVEGMQASWGKEASANQVHQ